MRLLSLYFILILAVPSLCSTVATLLADIAAIQNNLNSANSAITALNPDIANINLSTASQLLDIISAANTLIATLGISTADTVASLPLSLCVALNPSPVNDTDGRVILDRLEALEPSIIDSTAKLIDRKGVVAALPPILLVGNPLAIARATLASLKAALSPLENAAQAAAPASLQAEGAALRGRFDDNINAVIAAYSS
ncbi:hypothetical protein DXG01_001513 [Tephrocybe rancida]|nr:hypothetical protein DXG01_001513 [Tephrocybe rancida]